MPLLFVNIRDHKIRNRIQTTKRKHWYSDSNLKGLTQWSIEDDFLCKLLHFYSVFNSFLSVHSCANYGAIKSACAFHITLNLWERRRAPGPPRKTTTFLKMSGFVLPHAWTIQKGVFEKFRCWEQSSPKSPRAFYLASERPLNKSPWALGTRLMVSTPFPAVGFVYAKGVWY